MTSMSETDKKQTQYMPISRKYRPDKFAGIVGQEHVCQTLQNAIKLNRVAHAYLFTGARGVGKTTTARVFAKALNCPDVKDTTPCNKCSVCKEIATGINLDVLEIDGASNRGIDEIRNLREHVKLKPVTGKYRIYIIDEVHMLTPEAFNALLKTLEEPPAHVKFIFATTAPHKILPTILSRCQRFDFKLIANDIILEQLKDIAATEKIKIDDNAIMLIAKKANGSLRDAEMMLDQISSFTKSKITVEDISNMLGVVEQDILVNISTAIKEHQSNMLLNMLNELICDGKEPFFILNSLIEHFRNILIISECPDNNYVLANEEMLRQLKELAEQFSKDELFYIIKVLQSSVDQINKSSLSKMLLEVTLLKLARQQGLMPLDEIMSTINKLEYIVSKGGGNVSREVSPEPIERKAKAEQSHPAPLASRIPVVDDDEDEELDESAEYDTQSTVSSVAKIIPSDMPSKIKQLWPDILRGVKKKKVSTGMFLSEGIVSKVDGNNVVVTFSQGNSLHKETLELKSNVDVIEEVLKEVLSSDVNIKFGFSESEPGETEKKQSTNAQNSTQVDPVVVSAIDKFKGKIVGQYFLQEEQ